jgi:hypothetical protein
MEINMKKILVSLTVAIMLSACGGSDSENEDNNGGVVDNGNITYVAGEFKTASDASERYPEDRVLSGLGAGECVNQYADNYFESANTLIYGDPSLPDTDFKYAATMIENNLGKALNLMGLNRAQFDKYRPLYSTNVSRNMINFLDSYDDLDGNERNITSIDSDFVTPAGWSEMELRSRLSVIKGYWNGISNEKQGELIAIYNQIYNFDLTEGYNIPRKIIVCLDTSRDKVFYGESSILGMNIAPNSKSGRSDAEQVILHELIHTIQMNVSTPVDANSVNDVWFMEGQASFLAGQKVAASVGDFRPVYVVHFADVDTVFQDNLGLAYENYAKAYSYIDAHSGKERALKLLLDVRHYQGGGEDYTYYGVSGDRFSEAFAANILKKDGSQLTIQDFRNNYQYIMGN